MNKKNGPTSGMVIILSKSTSKSLPSWASPWMMVVRGMRLRKYEFKAEATSWVFRTVANSSAIR